MLRPYSLTYTPDSQRKRESKTTPNLDSVCAPASVVGWQDFTREAKSLALSDITPWYNEPRFIRHVVSEEWDVKYALNINILHVLSDRIGSNQIPKEVFTRQSGHREVQGEPAFLLVSGDRLILAIEVKTKWDLPVDDIVEVYQENLKDLAENRAPPVSVIDQIKEIYAYMGHNELQYGVLSTYENTWFLRRPQDTPGELFISDAVMNSAADPTLLQCFAYVMSLARRSPNSPVPPPASPAPPTEDCKPPSEQDEASKRSRADIERDSEVTQSKQSGEEAELVDFGWDDLKVIDILGYWRCGKVYKALFRGEEVAYKLCDLWKHPEYKEEFLSEVVTYTILEKLQGRSIPRLKGVGYTAGGFMAFVTEIAGSPIIVEELSNEERNEIVTALSDIHDHGVLHNNICPENILIQRHCDGFRVMFIGFTLSTDVTNERGTGKEMSMLRSMLRLPPLIKDGEYTIAHVLFTNACAFMILELTRRYQVDKSKEPPPA